MSYQAKNILVTGGAGFIGANFITLLLEKNAAELVINLDKITYAANTDYLKRFEADTKYQFIQGDICDAVLLKKIFDQYAIDTVVHFAAESHVDRSIAGPEVFIQSNILGTFQLLEAAKNYWIEENGLGHTACRFHHISTDEVYGSLSAHQAPVEEGGTYYPNSPYSASKAAADHLVRSYFKTYGLPITVSQCTNNYGPLQHAEKFIPMIIHACLAQKPIGLYGDGLQMRDWLYVSDHCEAILTILHRGSVGENYHIAANAEYSNLAVAQKLCRLMNDYLPGKQDFTNLITHISDRPGHDRRYALSNDKIKQLSWSPQFCFDEGLAKTLSYYL